MDAQRAERRHERRQARAARAAFVAGLSPAARLGLEAQLSSNLLPHFGAPGIVGSYAGAGVLGSYAAGGDEIDPVQVERDAMAAGWQIAFPRVTDSGILTFHRCRFAELRPGYRGIPEPPPDALPCRPDVLLVPLLRADLAGNRLGQGGGHYDRTLAALRASGPVLAIGIGYAVQLVDMVPAEPWDQPLDAVATPAAFHPAGPRARASA